MEENLPPKIQLSEQLSTEAKAPSVAQEGGISEDAKAKTKPESTYSNQPSLAPGKIILADSANHCLELSVQLQTISKVLFIDAGNVFNPYYIHRTFRGEVEIRQALGNISISRPFTIYQLKQAISDLALHLMPQIPGENFDSQSLASNPHPIPRVLIIPCIDDMFYEDGLDREEARAVFIQTIAKLREIVIQSNCYCFISFIGKYYRNIYDERA